MQVLVDYSTAAVKSHFKWGFENLVPVVFPGMGGPDDVSVPSSPLYFALLRYQLVNMRVLLAGGRASSSQVEVWEG